MKEPMTPNVRSGRWILGLAFGFLSIVGFSSGHATLGIIALLLSLLFLIPVLQTMGKKPASPSELNQLPSGVGDGATFSSKVSKLKYPDRTTTIEWHIGAIQKGLGTGDLKLVNLSYAKLIESLRQQAINNGGDHTALIKTVTDEYALFRSIHGLEYPAEFLPPSEPKAPKKEKALVTSKGLVINPGSNFPLSLSNAPVEVIHEARRILTESMEHEKERLLLPLFTQYNIRCDQVDAYVVKYRAQFIAKLAQLKAASKEYASSSEADKWDIEEELVLQATDAIEERADCDLTVLLAGQQGDYVLDDALISEYGFDAVYSYLGRDLTRIYVDRDRGEFDDLIAKGLAIPGDELPIADVLVNFPLKTLNAIAAKSDGAFSRKNKAIEHILQLEDAQDRIGKHIALRRVYKLKPLPERFQGIDANAISKSWAVTREEIKLLVQTYQRSQFSTEAIKGDLYGVKGFTLEKKEDWDSNFVCQKARTICKKKYSKSNPPKVPAHIGCTCEVMPEYD